MSDGSASAATDDAIMPESNGRAQEPEKNAGSIPQFNNRDKSSSMPNLPEGQGSGFSREHVKLWV